MYEELAEAVDDIAERIRALGFYVEASFTSFKHLTVLKDEGRVLPIPEMIQQLLFGHEHIIRKARHMTHLSDKENDFGTSDLLAKRLGAHEKFAWMLRSQL
jgi:starvation-inducible DNA-binding protein